MSESNTLTTQIIELIYSTGGFAWRASSVGVYDSKLSTYRTAPKKGVADVLGLYKGIFIAVEVKIGKDHLSPEQTGFLANVTHCGGYTFVAKTFPEFRAWWLSTAATIHSLRS